MFALRRPVFSTRFFSSVAKNMEKHGVVPDVIDVAPETVVEVIYETFYLLNTDWMTLGNLSKRGQGRPWQ